MLRRVAYGTMVSCLAMGWYFEAEQNHGATLFFCCCGMLIAAVSFFDALRCWATGRPAMTLSVMTRVLGFVLLAVELYALYNPNVELAHVALLGVCVLVLISTLRAPKQRLG